MRLAFVFKLSANKATRLFMFANNSINISSTCRDFTFSENAEIALRPRLFDNNRFLSVLQIKRKN